MKRESRSIVVVCAHPDDEVLGAGGAIQHHVDAGDMVSIVYVTDGFYTNQIDDSIAMRRSQARIALKSLGVTNLYFLGKHGLKLDTYPRVELNGLLTDIFRRLKPHTIYTHHWGDINFDHEIVFEMTMVASRPHRGININTVLTFETLSSTEWSGTQSNNAFIPNKYLILSEQQLNLKIDAFKCYGDEVLEYPSPRSLQGIENLARYRGQAISNVFAESYFIVRMISEDIDSS
jgi:LmbE family N-acetylglucosaminyl deacetylase